MEVYFDHSSATFVEPEVIETFVKVEQQLFANPDALHQKGLDVLKLQTQAREKIASLLNVKSEEIIFTSGGCEANTLALKGYIEKHKHLKNHVLVACGEHSSVINCLKAIDNIIVEEIPLNHEGNIDVLMLKNKINDNTLLVSISAIQNEFGAIRDVTSLANFLKQNNIVFHVDAVQALGKQDIDYQNVDLISFSGHKIHGLKGIGILVKKQPIQLNPIIFGGQQEFGLRGGTSSVALQVAFTKALRIALENMRKYREHILNLNDYLRMQLSKMPEVEINSTNNATPYILNFSVTVLPSQVILNALNQKGIYVSAVSTCVTKRKAVSTISCYKNDKEVIEGVIRVSFSYRNTKNEIDYFIKELKNIIISYQR